MIANPPTLESRGTCNHSHTSSDTETLQERISSLQSDNNFLRNLVDQSSKEKSILMTTIEGLQKENSSTSLKERVSTLVPTQTT
jgi:predicted RNase H-like nuclease (RuvC/YqgF family)